MKYITRQPTRCGQLILLCLLWGIRDADSYSCGDNSDWLDSVSHSEHGEGSLWRTQTMHAVLERLSGQAVFDFGDILFTSSKPALDIWQTLVNLFSAAGELYWWSNTNLCWTSYDIFIPFTINVLYAVGQRATIELMSRRHWFPRCLYERRQKENQRKPQWELL